MRIAHNPYLFKPARTIRTPDATVSLYSAADDVEGPMEDAGWYPMTVCIIGAAAFLAMAWIVGVR